MNRPCRCCVVVAEISQLETCGPLWAFKWAFVVEMPIGLGLFITSNLVNSITRNSKTIFLNK